MSIDDFKRWKVDVLRKYCQRRGLTTVSSKRKDELVALAYAAYSQNLPVVSSKEEEKSEAKQQYADLLTLQAALRYQIRSGYQWPYCGNGER